MRKKIVIKDRGLECQDEAYRHDSEYDEVRRNIITRGWRKFVDANGQSNVSMSMEFLANWPERQNDMIKVRRKNILVTPEAINLLYGVPDYTNKEEELIQEESRGIDKVHFAEVVYYRGYRLNDAKVVQRCKLNIVAKAWCIFISHRFLHTKNLARVGYDRLRYL